MSLIRFTEERYDDSGYISALYYGALGSAVGWKADTTLKPLQGCDEVFKICRDCLLPHIGNSVFSDHATSFGMGRFEPLVAPLHKS
jgi:hypothetical protein